ncbi:hypothetical protein L6164_008931 [Bauhinia variegata]|nr:hypothetical protein L6164_008931 [Bauhinia variegata]
MFSNIQVTDVETPIMIDQYYCDGGKCKNATPAVAVAGINYLNVKGTYTKEPVHLACSESLPCTDITLDTIELKLSQKSKRSNGPFCWEAYGELRTETVPPIDCLETGNPSKTGARANKDSC